MNYREVVYRQCYLACGARRQTVWIPEDYATVGNTLRFNKSEESWHVLSVGAQQPYELLREYERQDFPSLAS